MRVYTKPLLFAFFTVALAACNSNSSVTPVVGPSPTPVAYTAIGASDAVGYGASVPCTTASPALGAADPTCPEKGASGYVPDIVNALTAARIGTSLQDLGISGAVIGADIEATGNQYSDSTGTLPCPPRTGANAIPANFVVNELPSVSPTTTVVTIFAGGNDVNAIVNALACGAGGATAATQSAFITQEVTAFGNDYTSLISGIRSTAPNAKIFVANIPNFANVPYALALPAAIRSALQATSVAIDTNVINPLAGSGIPVVDVQCNASSYVSTNFYTDGFHPNDAGYATFAKLFVADILSPATSPAPLAQCSEQTVSGIALTRQAIPIGTALNLPR